MQKFLVISYYDGEISIDTVKDTYKEAKEWMDNDVKEFIAPSKLEDLDESECWIESYLAFVNNGCSVCDWVIKEIEV